MKNPVYPPILILSVLFLCFCSGVFFGRNIPGDNRTLSPVRTQHLISEVPVDLNQAGMQELMDLPGIGQTLADRILDYRQTKGGFSSLAELLNINGIGEAKLEALLPYITAGGKENENSGS